MKRFDASLYVSNIYRWFFLKIRQTLHIDTVNHMAGGLDIIHIMSGRRQHHRAAGALPSAESSCLEVDVIVDSWRHPRYAAAGAPIGHQQRRRHDNENEWHHRRYSWRGKQFVELTTVIDLVVVCESRWKLQAGKDGLNIIHIPFPVLHFPVLHFQYASVDALWTENRNYFSSVLYTINSEKMMFSKNLYQLIIWWFGSFYFYAMLISYTSVLLPLITQKKINFRIHVRQQTMKFL